ncbi:SDR family oxidoreductase [Pelagibius marinus]|uniref:SDR family oxidoreductase n=1 Tax=Pelagibius marinus TaxID=2762760 RepID=UPI0018725E99|nr:SDR family oxidoreductase [Pelagibius marinus]
MSEHARSPVEGKIVLVTGATSGIGRATALLLAKEGAEVVATGRREELLHSLRSEGGPGIRTIRGDLKDKDHIKDLVRQSGPIDVLINNAGISQNAPFLEGDMDFWDNVIETNISATFRLTQEVLRGMVERGSGHVVNVSSVVARQVFPNVAVYSATKHALAAFSEALRLEFHSKGIRVSEVAPGLVGDTDFLRYTENPTFLNGIKSRPYKPIASTDVARTILCALTTTGATDVSLLEVRPMGQP